MIRSKYSEDDLRPLLVNEAMSKDNGDPFPLLKDTLSSQVEKLKIKYEQALDLAKNNDPSSNDKFKTLWNDLVKDMRKAEQTLVILNKGVASTEQNRAKFPHIKDAELAQRRRIVEELVTKLRVVQAGRDSPLIRQKLESDQKRSRGRADDSNAIATSINPMREIDKNNDDFVANELETMKMNRIEMDKKIATVDKGVDSLLNRANEIKDITKEQDGMINELENDMDEAQAKMDFVTAALAKLLKSKDGCQIWTIVILAVILIILVALIIWL